MSILSLFLFSPFASLVVAVTVCISLGCSIQEDVHSTLSCSGPEIVDFIVELGNRSYFIVRAALACRTTI